MSKKPWTDNSKENRTNYREQLSSLLKKQRLLKKSRTHISEKCNLETTMELTTYEVSALITDPSPEKPKIQVSKIDEISAAKECKRKIKEYSLTDMISQTYGFLQNKATIAKSDFSNILRTPVTKPKNHSHLIDQSYLNQSLCKSTIPSFSFLKLPTESNYKIGELESFSLKKESWAQSSKLPPLQTMKNIKNSFQNNQPISHKKQGRLIIVPNDESFTAYQHSINSQKQTLQNSNANETSHRKSSLIPIQAKRDQHFQPNQFTPTKSRIRIEGEAETFETTVSERKGPMISGSSSQPWPRTLSLDQRAHNRQTAQKNISSSFSQNKKQTCCFFY